MAATAASIATGLEQDIRAGRLPPGARLPSFRDLAHRNGATIIARKLAVQKSLDLVRRRDRLSAQKAELGIVLGYGSGTILDAQELAESVRLWQAG